MNAVGLVVLGFLILLGFAAAAGWGGLSLQTTINPVDLGSLAVAVLVAQFLQSYVTNSRAEKDLLISQIREALSALKNCRDEFHRAADNEMPPEGKKTLALLRTLANELVALQSVLQRSQCSRLDFRSTFESYLRYKKAVTGDAFPAQPYGASDATAHARELRALQEHLHELLFKVNRH